MIFLELAYSGDDISNLLRIDIGRITHKTYNNILPSIYITRNLDFLNSSISSSSEMLQFRASGETRNIQCDNSYVTWTVPGTALQNKIKCNIVDLEKNLISVSFDFVYKGEDSPQKQQPSTSSFGDLAGTSLSNPSCESDKNATACKWEQKEEEEWFVFTQINVIDQELLLGNRAEQAPEPINDFCGEDSNSNSILEPFEFSECLRDGNNRLFCTHDNIDCTEVTADPICLFDGVFDSPNNRCKHPLISVTCPMSSPFVYDQGIEKCFRDPVCPDRGIFKSVTNTCNISLTNGDCPDGFFYSNQESSCIKNSVCLPGTVFNDTAKRCEGLPTDSCYLPYSQNGNLCQASVSCPSGSSYSTTLKRCVRAAVKNCPSGTTLVDNICQSTPTCPPGSTFSFANKRCESPPSGGGYTQCTILSHDEIWLTSPSTYQNTYPQDFYLSSESYSSYYGNPGGQLYFLWGTMPFYIDNSFFDNNCNLNTFLKNNSGTISISIMPGENKLVKHIGSGYAYIGDTGRQEKTFYHNKSESPISCSIGYLVGNICISNPTCPTNTTLNSNTGFCEKNPDSSCAEGFFYFASSDTCAKIPDCPMMIDGIAGAFNEATEKCEAIFSKNCPSGLSGNGTPPTLCFTEQVCPIGVYRLDSNSCAIYGSSFCPPGYPFNASTNECIKPLPDCPHPSKYDSNLKKCVDPTDPIYNCPETYSYNPTFKDCSTYPICEAGAYRPATKDCWDNEWACPYGGDRPCVPFQSKQQCSKFDCHDFSSSTPIGDPEGANDKEDDGEIDDSGDCLGQIYIYNGQDNRCRNGGVTLTGGSCCKEEDYAMGLLKCNPKEIALMKLRGNGVCHEVGEYCSKEINLMFGNVCVEKSKRYCCFNSKLARIIHQQGRPQIDGLDWGTPESPTCRGFTPEEFERLDFSKINLSEFYKDIEVKEMDHTVLQDTLTDSFNRKDQSQWKDPMEEGSKKVNELYNSVPLPE